MTNLVQYGNTFSLLATGRIFGLDKQLLVDVCFQGIAILILFAFLSYILFEPVKKMLNNRKEKVQNDLETAAANKEEALKLKETYDAKIKEVDKEAEEILSNARKKALKRENDIVEEAKEEAARIMARANNEIELEKNKLQDEIKVEIVKVAAVMAGKMIKMQMDESMQNALIQDTLKEMADEILWLLCGRIIVGEESVF